MEKNKIILSSIITLILGAYLIIFLMTPKKNEESFVSNKTEINLEKITICLTELKKKISENQNNTIVSGLLDECISSLSNSLKTLTVEIVPEQVDLTREYVLEKNGEKTNLQKDVVDLHVVLKREESFNYSQCSSNTMDLKQNKFTISFIPNENGDILYCKDEKGNEILYYSINNSDFENQLKSIKSNIVESSYKSLPPDNAAISD